MVAARSECHDIIKNRRSQVNTVTVDHIIFGVIKSGSPFDPKLGTNRFHLKTVSDPHVRGSDWV